MEKKGFWGKEAREVSQGLKKKEWDEAVLNWKLVGAGLFSLLLAAASVKLAAVVFLALAARSWYVYYRK